MTHWTRLASQTSPTTLVIASSSSVGCRARGVARVAHRGHQHPGDVHLDDVDLAGHRGVGEHERPGQRLGEVGLALQGAGGAAQHEHHPVRSRLAGDRLADQRDVGLLELLAEHRDEQVDLRGEVAVERAEGDVGPLGDGPHLHLLEAALGRRGRRPRRGSAGAAPAGPGSRAPRRSASWCCSRWLSHGPRNVAPRRLTWGAAHPPRRLAPESRIIGTRSSPCCAARRAVPSRPGGPVAHRPAVLPQQAALRRPGRLRPPPDPRAGGLGHDVEVFSGQPYPELDPGVRLTEGAEPGPLPRAGPVPDAAAARVPRRGRRARGRDRCGPAGFPEPLTFSLRVAAAAQAAGWTTSTSSTTTSPSATACSPWSGPACRSSPPSTTRSPSTAPRPRRRATTSAQAAHAAPLVRLPAHAEPGGPRASSRCCAVGELARATSSPTSASTATGCTSPGRRRQTCSGRPIEPRVPGRHRDHGQRRRPDEGPRDRCSRRWPRCAPSATSSSW